MYYLWRDKKGVFYVTDYKEIRTDGFVNIDRFGFLEVKEVASGPVKMELFAKAQEIVLNEPPKK